MSRVRGALLMCCALGFGILAAAEASPEGHPERARIPHLDGSGHATIVEIQPGVPGRAEFMRATPERIPEPGELLLTTPSACSSPQPGGETPVSSPGRRGPSARCLSD